MATTVVAWPIALVAAEYVFILRAALALGRWPRPGDPDPGALGFHTLDGLLGVLIVGYPVVVIFALAATVVHTSPGARLPWPQWAAAWIAVLLAVVVLHALDPGGALGWLAD